ncbi:tetratricopeptide repeat protein [Chondromyces apiculatus]|uniref:Tetratricopeptide repeat protein n=1 Tax=Chondromyces apiculatus DSM 436 TaxID=1192034 RepID=A0A017T0M0_9BACT|nr:tetratricopeptide repeat protein [Chondromyces apiculatus]EYF02527.1 Hypothetical protein CAP_6734 [Chondromyces apiculatus DSM 436]
MIKLLLRAPLTRDEMDGFARGEGFAPTRDTPWTSGIRTTSWARGDDTLACITDASAGASLLAVHGPGEHALAQRARKRLGGQDTPEVLAEARGARDAARRVRSLMHLGFLLHGSPDAANAEDEATALLRQRLTDADQATRWAAYRVALNLGWPSLDEAMAGAARQHEDMQPALERWKAHRQREDAARASEEAARQEAARLAGLSRLASERQWTQLLTEASAVIAGGQAFAEGFRHHALALEGLGHLPAAITEMLAAAAVAADDERAVIDEALPRLTSALEPSPEAAEEVVNALLDVRAWLPEPLRDEALVRVLRGLLTARTGAQAELTLALGAMLDKTLRAEAVEVLEQAATLAPELPEAWYTLGNARAQLGQHALAAAAFEEALKRLDPARPRAGASARAARLYAHLRRRVTTAAITSALLRSTLEDRQYARALDVAEAAVARDPGSIVAWEKRALALTFLSRHEEAIQAYGDALAAIAHITAQAPPMTGDVRGLLHFNRACEQARLGRKQEALADLREARRFSDDWGPKALHDDYFAPLWTDRDFLLVAHGREDSPPTRAEVEQLTRRSMGLFFSGEGDEAVEAGEEAVSLAEILGDPALLSDALKALGNALTYVKGPAQGISRLERAVQLAEQAFPDHPDRRAEARHLLGAAHHAGGDHDAASRHYRAALAERIAAMGEGHWLLAKSHGDIARLEADQGRLTEAVASIEQGRALLRAFLDGALDAAPSGDDRIEALFDLTTLSSNLGRVHLDAGALAPAVSALDDAASGLASLVAAGRRPAAPLVRNALRHATFALQRADDEALRDRAARLAQQLFEILEPSPRARAERLYWAHLRAGARQLVEGGIPEQAIAAAMRDALRGEGLPEPLRAHPAFQNLPIELATRLGQRGDLVLVAMALSTAIEGGSLDEALEQLEEIAVAGAQMGDPPDTEEDGA